MSSHPPEVQRTIAAAPGLRWAWPLAVAVAILFLIDLVFPAAVALAMDAAPFPRSHGAADVTVAFVLAIVAFAMHLLVRSRVDEQSDQAADLVYRFPAHGLPAVAVVVMVAAASIHWDTCATGFLWRSWLLLYILPAWFTGFRMTGAANLMPRTF